MNSVLCIPFMIELELNSCIIIITAEYKLLTRATQQKHSRKYENQAESSHHIEWNLISTHLCKNVSKMYPCTLLFNYAFPKLSHTISNYTM